MFPPPLLRTSLEWYFIRYYGICFRVPLGLKVHSHKYCARQIWLIKHCCRLRSVEQLSAYVFNLKIILYEKYFLRDYEIKKRQQRTSITIACIVVTVRGLLGKIILLSKFHEV